LLDFSPIMPAFCLLLLYSYYSNNFAGKIDASLAFSIFFLATSSFFLAALASFFFLAVSSFLLATCSAYQEALDDDGRIPQDYKFYQGASKTSYSKVSTFFIKRQVIYRSLSSPEFTHYNESLHLGLL